MARSTAPLFSTGSTPGNAMSIAEAWQSILFHFRHALVPIGRLLILVREVEDLRFAKVMALNQHADGQSLRIETAGNRNSRRTGQVACDGEDVVQVHLDRVVGLVAD